MLLLDEPTAGMGPEERWQMIETVQACGAPHMTLIFIEHDMDIVFKVAADGVRAVLRRACWPRERRTRSGAIRR